MAAKAVGTITGGTALGVFGLYGIGLYQVQSAEQEMQTAEFTHKTATETAETIFTNWNKARDIITNSEKEQSTMRGEVLIAEKSLLKAQENLTDSQKTLVQAKEEVNSLEISYNKSKSDADSQAKVVEDAKHKLTLAQESIDMERRFPFLKK